jgi:predicted RNA-binding protein associated with RNAse of E/G family
MRFAPGQPILRRYFRAERICFLNVCRVLADDERGLRLWIPIGTPYWRALTPDGRDFHAATVEEIVGAELGELTWHGSHVLVFMPPHAAYSVWWFFAPDGSFTGWYGNLEEPYTRWPGGVDTVDHALDLWVEPDRTWRWKDEDEFTKLIGHPVFWNTEQAAQIRAEGERLIKLVEAGEFPFDGTWCDERPDPGWPTLVRPDGWDTPHTGLGT